MSRARLLLPFVFAGLVLTDLPAPTLAQGVPAECKPIIDAGLKVITTPHHIYMSEGPATKGAAPTTSEMITVGDVNYVLYQGKWMRSPMSPKDVLAQSQDNIKNTKVMSCQRVGAEQVAGQSAIIYAAHSENDAGKSDTRLWISTASGLPLKQEESIDAGMGSAMHMSIRYEYSNVHAPAGM